MSGRFVGHTSVNVSLGCLDLCPGVHEVIITMLLVTANPVHNLSAHQEERVIKQWLSHS